MAVLYFTEAEILTLRKIVANEADKVISKHLTKRTAEEIEHLYHLQHMDSKLAKHKTMASV